METVFLILAFIGTFSSGFFCALFIGACMVIAQGKDHSKRRRNNDVF